MITTIIIFLQYLSPILGFIGTVLIFFFGVPRQIDTGGANYIICEGEDEEEKKKIRKYKLWGNVGLIIVALGFLMNLIALLFMQIKEAPVI